MFVFEILLINNLFYLQCNLFSPCQICITRSVLAASSIVFERCFTSTNVDNFSEIIIQKSSTASLTGLAKFLLGDLSALDDEDTLMDLYSIGKTYMFFDLVVVCRARLTINFDKRNRLKDCFWLLKIRMKNCCRWQSCISHSGNSVREWVDRRLVGT